MHHTVHMHAKNWLNILLKKDFLDKKRFTYFTPKN